MSHLFLELFSSLAETWSFREAHSADRGVLLSLRLYLVFHKNQKIGWLCSRSDAADETHPKQDPGVKPSLHQEGHVEMDKQERIDPQPYQL